MAVDAVQQAMQGLDTAEQHSNATRAAAGQVWSDSQTAGCLIHASWRCSAQQPACHDTDL